MCECGKEIKEEVRSWLIEHEQREVIQQGNMIKQINLNTLTLETHIRDTSEIVAFIRSMKGFVSFMDYLFKAGKYVVPIVAFFGGIWAWLTKSLP